MALFYICKAIYTFLFQATCPPSCHLLPVSLMGAGGAWSLSSTAQGPAEALGAVGAGPLVLSEWKQADQIFSSSPEHTPLCALAVP